MKSVVKRILGVCMVLVMAASVLAGCGGQPAKPPAADNKAPAQSGPAKPPEHKVGAVISLTGPASVWGEPMRNSMNLLADGINAKGGIGGVPLKLVILDDESDPTKALVAAKKLVSEEKVLAILGGATSPTSMAMVKYLEESGVPMVSMGSSDAIITPINERKFIFKPVMRSQFMAELIVGFLEAKGVKKVAFMSAADAYGDSGLKAYEEASKNAKAQLVIKEKFAGTDKDMKPQLTKIKAAGAEAVVVWAIPPAASIINKNYKELGLNAMLIHSYGAASSYYVELAGQEAVEGTYLATDKTWMPSGLPAGDAQRKAIEAYTKGYKDKYGKDISPTGALAYDNLALVIQGIEKVGPTVERRSLRDALEGTKGFISVTGNISMSPTDHNGHPISDYVIGKMDKGQWKIEYQGK